MAEAGLLEREVQREIKPNCALNPGKFIEVTYQRGFREILTKNIDEFPTLYDILEAIKYKAKSDGDVKNLGYASHKIRHLDEELYMDNETLKEKRAEALKELGFARIRHSSYEQIINSRKEDNGKGCYTGNIVNILTHKFKDECDRKSAKAIVKYLKTNKHKIRSNDWTAKANAEKLYAEAKEKSQNILVRGMKSLFGYFGRKEPVRESRPQEREGYQRSLVTA